MRRTSIDRVFLITTAILCVLGFIIFTSASLGLHARSGATLASVTFNQGFLGIFLGFVLLLVAIRIPYRFWYRYSLDLFILACLIALLVFVPGIGAEFGGARRWIIIGPFSFQPAEFLKPAFVLYFASVLFKARGYLASFHKSIVPLAIILGITGGLLLLQPNTSNCIVIFLAGIGMFLIAGGKWRYVCALVILGIAGVTFLVFTKPYIHDRVATFLDPSSDALGASYQVQQSLIAIGSGKIFGRGFGQSIQKFGLLPEPIGDSIFAVAGEEFGFVGSVGLVFLFLFFAYRGLLIAARAPDLYGGLVASGIVILIISQSFLNIAAMLGIIPLTGTGLLFVSHGGSALLFALFEVGILLNISSYNK